MSEIPAPGNEQDLAPEWQQVFAAAAPGLRAFLSSRLAQSSDVDDCLQVVLVRMIEHGGSVAPAARRSWLFRVAANESARVWRSRAATEEMLQRHGAQEASQDDPTQSAIRSEASEILLQALAQLPERWQQVVRLRIHENLTFQQIAQRLDIPLGTALTQMRRAMERLRSQLESDDET
jgi:RNA polymerase sigma-70 factor (ECF subfamily)